MAVEDQDVVQDVVRLSNGDQPEQEPERDAAAIYIDGQGYTFDDLTFEEQALYEKWLREDIAPPVRCRPCRGEGVIRLDASVELCPRCGGEGEINEARERDYVVAMITVVKRRTEPQFTIADARRVRPRDLEKPRPT